MDLKDNVKRFLRRPYELYSTQTGSENKINIVFLHGIASDSTAWQYVLPNLSENINPICIDLLGFGKSPKPNWPDYSLKTHAKSVLYTLKKLGVNGPFVLAGHSMGGLIALEIAKQKPNLVKYIVLCGTPLYAKSEINQAIINYKKSDRRITNGLFLIYEKIIEKEELTLASAQKIMNLSDKISTFELTKETWIPFKKSLQNSVMQQNSLDTISKLNQPIILTNGLLDLLIIKRHHLQLARTKNNIETQTVAGGHMINPVAGKKIAKTINTRLGLGKFVVLSEPVQSSRGLKQTK